MCKSAMLLGLLACVWNLSDKAKREVALKESLSQRLVSIDLEKSGEMEDLQGEIKALQASSMKDAQEIYGLKDELRISKVQLEQEI